MKSGMKFGIFTKPQHVEKIVNFLNENTDLHYIISTNRYEPLAYDFDIGVSYCFPWVIDSRYNDGMLLENKDWYNYHPAPLPFYGGWGNYQKGIKAGIKEWGVSLHRMTEHVDEGPVLKVKYFKLDSPPVNTQELGDISHYHLFQLFKETIKLLEHCPKTDEELKKELEAENGNK